MEFQEKKVSQEPMRDEEYLNRHLRVGQFTTKSSSTTVSYLHSLEMNHKNSN